MFLRDAGIEVSEIVLLTALGMSKMTVVFESQAAEAKKYKNLKLVEFYEVIGRVAEARYREN